jgi:hypothetical protein
MNYILITKTMIQILWFFIQNYWPFLLLVPSAIFIIWFFMRGFRNARIAREKEAKIYKDALDKNCPDEFSPEATFGDDKPRKVRFEDYSGVTDVDLAFLNEIY